jgi:hypothetical protein
METRHAIFGCRFHSATSAPIPQIPTNAVAPTKFMKPRIIHFYYATVASSHLGPDTYCIILFSLILSLCSSFTVKNLISYPCTTVGILTL